MSLLKQITVHGEIKLDRAYLTVEYVFVNTRQDRVLPQYVFPVPRGGEITGLQMLNEDAQLVRAKLFSVSEESLRADGVCLTQIAPDLYCLQGQELNMGESVRFLVELFLPLVRCGEEAKLVFPLGIAPKTADKEEPCLVNLTLYLDGALVHASHPTEQQNGCVSATFFSGRDFVLTVASERKSSCLIQETWDESIGVYRLFSQNPAVYRKEKKKKALLLLDSSWAGDGRLDSAVRELCFRALQALPMGTPVQVRVGSWETPVFSDFVPANESAYQTLLSVLTQIPAGGTVRELLCSAAETVEKDTAVILFSAGRGIELPLVKGLPRVHLVTVGNISRTSLGASWCLGEHLHCYPEEVPARKMEAAVIRWMCSPPEVQVSLQEGVKDVLIVKDSNIAQDGYMDLVLRTSGQIPTEFTVYQDGVVKETVCVTQGERKERLPIAERIYGRAKCTQLEELLMRTDWGSYQTVKQQIETISLRYGVLTRETVLAIPQTGGKDASVVTFSLGESGGFQRQTIFGETVRSVRQRQKLISECFETLIRNIRADGGIYQGVNDREGQTAYAILALSGQKEKDRALDSVIRNGERYLNARAVSGTAAFLYQHRGELFRKKETLMHHIPDLEALLYQERSVTVAAQILLHLS